MLILAELTRNNTPIRAFGFTPRDLMCNWSVASPLERELIPADAGAELVDSEVAKKQFQSWRLMRQLVLQHLGREHAQAAKLVNRYR